MNTEEAEQFLMQAGIRFKEEFDELRFKDYGELDELESNTVSLDSSDEKDEPEWEYGKIPGEEEEEEYRDPTPSMRAYALKCWHYPQYLTLNVLQTLIRTLRKVTRNGRGYFLSSRPGHH
jgi:hypothetical protein